MRSKLLLAAAAAKGDRTGASVEDRIGNLTDSVETIAALAEECNTITSLIDMLYNLFDNTAESPTPCVTLTSVHKSKGREWSTVYVLADTLRSGGEESRIAYVAYTRAKNRLVLARGVDTGQLHDPGIRTQYRQHQRKLRRSQSAADKTR